MPIPQPKKTPHPFIPVELLEYLERAYPDRAPDPSDSERMIWMKAGQVDLVRKLRSHYTRQTDEAMRSA